MPVMRMRIVLRGRRGRIRRVYFVVVVIPMVVFGGLVVGHLLIVLVIDYRVVAAVPVLVLG